MSDSDTQPTDPIAIGARVTVIQTSGSRSRDTKPQVGTVVEDFADTVIDDTDPGSGLSTGGTVGDRPRRRSIGPLAAEGGLELA